MHIDKRNCEHIGGVSTLFWIPENKAARVGLTRASESTESARGVFMRGPEETEESGDRELRCGAAGVCTSEHGDGAHLNNKKARKLQKPDNGANMSGCEGEQAHPQLRRKRMEQKHINGNHNGNLSLCQAKYWFLIVKSVNVTLILTKAG